ncbi:hypothetical protein CIL03_06805 [Virgibacillus indicus]|uniref:Abortive phage infection protein C-terminal domain-containing protein n=1 Tax=Virgibacillus indicus TaxID=2024554 RepID=A0A265NDP2_9BACI|nr:AIPR family protein [Virgibacillus indicus]OZU89416.1 hypothetical protein CIL03_06805 [Virgibacillus indicus]
MKEELKSVTIDADLKEFMINNKKILMGFVSGKALREKTNEIPNKPNTRDFMGDGNKYVPEMRKTLRNKPESFVYMNNGIHIIAESSIRNEDGTRTVFFKGQQGIFNGIHTENVQETYGKTNSYVILVIYFDIPEEELVDIIIAKNASTPTKEISRGEKLERYEWIKELLPNYPIKYKESDNNDLDIATILHIAGIFQVNECTHLFTNKDYRKFQSYLRNKGDVVKKHNNGKLDLKRTRYILKDLINLYLYIRSDEECIVSIKRNLKKIGWIRKGVITDSLMFNILNALNFAVYIPNTLYPCFKKNYDSEHLIGLTKSVFPQIVKQLQIYEEEGLKVSEISREKNIYQEIQNIMLTADLEQNLIQV